MAIGENGFGVELRQAKDGSPVVVIVDATGRVLSEKGCRDGTEARTYASTVRQHIYWLSAEKFREYYKI
jgi:hypothetical protein